MGVVVAAAVPGVAASAVLAAVVPSVLSVLTALAPVDVAELTFADFVDGENND